MAKVYRIQNKEGEGPFIPGFTRKWIGKNRDIKAIQEAFPETIDTIRKDKNNFYGSACLSLDQLRKWFTYTEYRKLKKLGFRCFVVCADIVISDDNQAIIKSVGPFRIVRQLELYHAK